MAAPALAAEPQWLEIQSPHFSVDTDAGEKRGCEVAMRFEQMRAVFSALLVKANVNIPIATNCCLSQHERPSPSLATVERKARGACRGCCELLLSTKKPWARQAGQ